jgi:hypothetical protein
MKLLISILVVVFRLYLIFNLSYSLYISRGHPEQIGGAQWYVYVLVLDLYIIKMFDKSNYDDIYSNKE